MTDFFFIFFVLFAGIFFFLVFTPFVFLRAQQVIYKGLLAGFGWYGSSTGAPQLLLKHRDRVEAKGWVKKVLSPMVPGS